MKSIAKLVALTIVITWPALAFAGRPLTVDDAGTVELKRFQLEAGYSYEHDAGCDHSDFPVTLNYGLTPKLQVGVGFGSQLDEREDALGRHTRLADMDDITLNAKWNPLSAEHFWADHSLSFTIKVPTASHDKGFGSGETDYDLMYIATKSLGERFNVDFNVGYTWVGDSRNDRLDDSLHYGLALRWQAVERVELVGEVFADTPITSENDTTVAMNAGVRWEVVDDLVLDAAAGAGLRGDAPDVTATVGLTWTFGFGSKSDQPQK